MIQTIKNGVLGIMAMAIAAMPQAVGAATPEEMLEEAAIQYDDYDFQGAIETINAYEKAIKKAKKSVAPEAEEIRQSATKAQNALYTVEKLVIIDSLNVSRDDFFRAYKLPASAGRLTDGRSFPLSGDRPEYLFHSENDDYLIWSQPDSIGTMRLNEARRLVDGGWHSDPVEVPCDGDAIYPFMLSDGVTLYFASDGDDSYGGYDIFKATRDSETDEFMEPVNIGMPYNSPYNEYLMAIDEENGIGWWATDRNDPDGSDITIYVYRLNDMRENYDYDAEEDIASLARIADYKSTWGDSDYSSHLRTIAAIKPGKAPKKQDFHFPLRDGRVLTSWSDIETPDARSIMQRYLDAEADLLNAEQDLEKRRSAYATDIRKSDSSSLLKLEQAVEKQRENVKKLRNDVFRTLGYK